MAIWASGAYRVIERFLGKRQGTDMAIIHPQLHFASQVNIVDQEMFIAPVDCRVIRILGFSRSQTGDWLQRLQRRRGGAEVVIASNLTIPAASVLTLVDVTSGITGNQDLLAGDRLLFDVNTAPSASLDSWFTVVLQPTPGVNYRTF